MGDMEDVPAIPLSHPLAIEMDVECPVDTARRVSRAGSTGSNHSTEGRVVAARQTLKVRRAASMRSCRRTTDCTRTTLFRPTVVIEESSGMQAWRRFQHISLRVVDSTAMIAFTTLLTVYALIGDDMRLCCTEATADTGFNVMTIICLSIFSLDLCLAVAGKEDYFLGFFFWLDVISTLSLVLDLTWVTDAMSDNDEDEVDVSGSKTARIGARLVRIVRVLRLVRIFKLYKTIIHGMNKTGQIAVRPGDDDDWDDVDLEDEDDEQESRVGRKLSELTTRHVILLVLTMMLGLPFLIVDEAEQLPFSSIYGVDVVNQAFDDFRNASNVSASALKLVYQEEMLRYIYYHNWFRDECPDGKVCRSDFRMHLFWVGFVGQSITELQGLAQEARLDIDQVDAFESQYVNQDRLYHYQAMPRSVREILGSQMSEYCSVQTGNENRRLGMSLLRDLINDKITYRVPCPENLRVSEYVKASPVMITRSAAEQWHLAFYFDLRDFTRNEAAFSLIMVAFVCVLLCVFSVQFAQDAQRLVLSPVESMISKVDKIRKNPLMAMKMADDEFKREEARKAQMKKGGDLKTILINLATCSSGSYEVMETMILEKTIIKLGSLLVLGFGEAGANIIEQNMDGVESACVDAMVMGTRVECIVGNVRIRDFSTATEVLQGKVMTFVNQIAEIVHGVVDELHGAINKNNGDVFVVIWRTSGLEPHKAEKLADMSMLAFSRILAAVHRSPVLYVYREHPGLQQRQGTNCRVHLSFGLHSGWAIEGAVGSEFKIDASYLSPNVSIAETVERATQIYGVSILVAESVIIACSPEMAALCRLIDRVIITGSTEPMELYTIDLNFMALSVETQVERNLIWNSRQRFRVRQFLEAEKNQKWGDEVHVEKLFHRHQDVLSMRARLTAEFMNIFNMGYQNYSQGEWKVAHRLLSKTQSMLGVDDGPSTALLHFMESPHNFVAPANW
eukprot:CAMPEP_0194488616 /NCGR_PEP_ID=MMETSP0253-20130528/8472_1 /TAXON_ID=2966 /ORGANISM="Noctiluca scintillans" /LENGTH=959 /DNA_ID=CAMNT_0039329007 /DNA_START=62 /DNA_END=2938 /DNA_ORIENTATION=-